MKRKPIKHDVAALCFGVLWQAVAQETVHT